MIGGSNSATMGFVPNETLAEKTSTRNRLTDLVILGGIGVALVIAVTLAGPGSVAESIGQRLTSEFGFFFSVTSVGLIALLFILEYRFPAREDERGFSPSIVFDALYLLVQLPIVAILLPLLVQPIGDFVAEHASYLVIDTTRRLPTVLLLVAGAAIADFALWLSHLIRHKVPFLWRFHMIHHSQTRLNLFTASRDHPLDNTLEAFIRVLPMAVLFPSVVESAQAIALYGLAVSWHIRFTHANIGTNLGPLRYVFVTPQSHRIHHSADPEHWNSNYANVFCWDRLFGTQHVDDTTYPPTGLNDPDFPEPKSLSLLGFARCYWRQLVFPFDASAVRRATFGPSPRLDNGADQTLAA